MRDPDLINEASPTQQDTTQLCPNEHMVFGYYGTPTGCTVEQCSDLAGAVLRFRSERDEARAALARVEALCDDADAALRQIFPSSNASLPTSHIRRAITGEAS